MKVYARCQRLLGEESAAEDATQETFMRVQRHLEKAPTSQEALAWVYRIATNYCLNVLRDRKREPESTDALPEMIDFAPMVGRSGDAEARFSNRDFARRVISRAPEKVASVAWLHYVDGLDQGEVARVLGISRRTVVNRLGTFLHNARQFATRSEA